MKKNILIKNWKVSYFIALLLNTFLTFSQSTPHPEDAPGELAGKSGPPPPPPSPIDNFIFPMIIFGLLFVLYLYCKRRQVLYNKEP